MHASNIRVSSPKNFAHLRGKKAFFLHKSTVFTKRKSFVHKNNSPFSDDHRGLWRELARPRRTHIRSTVFFVFCLPPTNVPEQLQKTNSLNLEIDSGDDNSI